jgi:serine/threonine protein kinase
MLCGIPPFYNENIERMYDLIKLSNLRFPKRVQISDDAKDLITKVLKFLLKIASRERSKFSFRS